MARKQSINVQTITGLQSMLRSAASELSGLENKDLSWVRTTVATVNAGNSLLRTGMLLKQHASKPKKK